MDPTQKAFQEYMLRGKGLVVSTSSPPSIPPTRESWAKKRKKQVGPILKAFQGRVGEWKDLDGQLKAVLGSIANLRDRIWWESCQLQTFTETAKDWEGFGFRSRCNLLSRADVDMALTHDLLQHEKMLSGARTLISSLAQVQEAMGRRLDEWMMFQLEEPVAQGQELLEQAQEAYLLLGGEVYRKQVLVQKVLDSCHDGLVDKDATQSLGEGGSPRTVARQCCKSWSSRGKDQWAVVGRMLNASSINY
jgi:hypothetical protein